METGSCRPRFFIQIAGVELKSVATQTIVVFNITHSQSMNQFSDKISTSPARYPRGLSLLPALLLLPLGG